MLILIDIVEENRVNSGKYRNIEKNRNKIVEILAKSQNLSKSKLKNLLKFKNFSKFKVLVV